MTPTAVAECHCVGVTCLDMINRYDENGNGTLNAKESKKMIEEEGECKGIILVLLEFLDNDLSLSGYITGDETVVAGDGDITVPKGGTAHVHFGFSSLYGANQTGSMRLGTGAGYHVAPATGDFDTSGNAVVEFALVIAEDAPETVMVPYTVTRAGLPDHHGQLALHTASEATSTGTGLTPLEIGLIGGVLGAILGAVLGVVVMLGWRR